MVRWDSHVLIELDFQMDLKISEVVSKRKNTWPSDP